MNNSLKKTGLLFFTGFLFLVAAVGYFLNRVERTRLHQEERAVVDRVLDEAAASLQSRIYANIHKVSAVKPLVAMNPDLTQDDFTRAMSFQFAGQEELRNIGLARDMVLSFLYPIEGNEAAIGLDYRELPDQLPAVELALEQDQIVLAGPLDLVQGGQGLVARIPIRLPDPVSGTDTFWGFASAVIHVDILMERAGFLTKDPSVRLAVRGRDSRGEEGEVFLGDPALFDRNPVTAPIPLPYGSWQVAALPEGGWRSGPAGFTPLMSVYGIGSLLLLISVGLISILSDRQKKYWEDLERERNLFAAGPVWHMEWDPEPVGNWKLRYVSSNVEPILGYAPEELTDGGTSFHSLIHPEDLDRVVERLVALIETGVDCYEEKYRLVAKDGSILSIYDYTMLVRNEWGMLTCIRSYMYDETARVEAETALRAAEEQLQKTAYELTENIPVGTYTMLQPPEGGLGNFCFMSSRFLELTGLTREVAERDPLEAFACVHPDDYDDWVALNAEAFAKQSAFFGETRVVVKGEIRWITAESKPRRLPDGSMLWEGVLSDITPMKQIQQALQESVDRFNDLVSYVSVGVYVLWIRADGAMDCEYVSDGWCSMTGLSRESVMEDWGAAIRVIHPEEREAFIALNRQVCRDRKPFLWEGRVLVNGATTYARIQSNPVFFENGDSRWFGVHQDITPQRAMERELIDAKNQAEAASVAKGRFLAMMSHELRTPLNGVIGFSELLGDTTLSEEQKQFVDYIHVSGNTLLTLISDILDFSKIEAGMMELEAFETDIHRLCKDCLDINRYIAEQKKLELRLETHPDLPGRVLLDPMRLKQILINLVGNAVKFTAAGEVVLRVGYSPEDSGRGRLYFSVRDTGIGISEAERANLFKPFSQADSSTTRRFGGTGLGLAIAGMIAGKMGGGIQLESAPGQGSTFSFDVTVSLLPEPDSPEHPFSGHESFPPRGEGGVPPVKTPQKLLIVEDVFTNRLVLSSLLVKLLPNTLIFEAENGKDAIEKYSTHQPDLIFMDVQMPEMNGLEAIARIRGLEADAGHRSRMVVVTADASVEERENALDAGADTYMTKPVDVDVLKSVLLSFGFLESVDPG